MTIKIITKKSLEEASTKFRINKIAGKYFSIEQDPAGYSFIPILVNGTPSTNEEYIRIPGPNFLDHSSIVIYVTNTYLKHAKNLAELIQRAVPKLDITVIEK